MKVNKKLTIKMQDVRDYEKPVKSQQGIHFSTNFSSITPFSWPSNHSQNIVLCFSFAFLGMKLELNCLLMYIIDSL